VTRYDEVWLHMLPLVRGRAMTQYTPWEAKMLSIIHAIVYPYLSHPAPAQHDAMYGHAATAGFLCTLPKCFYPDVRCARWHPQA
jgi:hypothetical protein